MIETHSTLDRLEARIDYQAARIDALYAVLEARGLFHRPINAGKREVLFDELEEAPLARATHARLVRRQVTRFHVGDATGV